jgi:ABC-type uncharacterized transport system substrate-binding protein
MQPVHGRTRRIRALRVWQILPLLLLASCQTRGPVELPAKTKVAVLVASNSPHVRRLQNAVEKSLGENGRTVHAARNRSTTRRLARKLSQSSYSAVVALDTGAINLARKIRNKPIYFGQCFDYRLATDLGKRFRGVSIVPSAGSVFEILHTLDTSPRTIGIVGGDHLEPMIKAIEQEAKKYRYKVVFRRAANDREFLFQAKQIAKVTDIYWLLPDSRILSGSAIKHFMRWTVRDGKPVISFTPTLLKLGALMSVEVKEDAVANEIKQLLVTDFHGRGKSAPVMKYVSTMNVRISRLSAARMGIVVPASLKRYQHD